MNSRASSDYAMFEMASGDFIVAWIWKEQFHSLMYPKDAVLPEEFHNSVFLRDIAKEPHGNL